MTTSQLREWSFQNNQPDQWWLSLDSVTQEIPVTVAEIEERLKLGYYGKIQILHISQSKLEHPPWVDVITQPPTIPQAPESYSVLGTATQSYRQNPAQKKSGFGELTLLIILSILIPLAGIIIGIIRLCKSESRKEGLILMSVSVLTMIVFISVFSE